MYDRYRAWRFGIFGLNIFTFKAIAILKNIKTRSQ